MKAGYVHGASDRYAAYPSRSPVSPSDIAATIYSAMGIDPQTRIHDQLNRRLTFSDRPGWRGRYGAAGRPQFVVRR